MSDLNHRLTTSKADLGETRLEPRPAPAPLAEGEVLLGLDRFSLTTNNVTYAAYGDAIGYWKVFPTGEPCCWICIRRSRDRPASPTFPSIPRNRCRASPAKLPLTLPGAPANPARFCWAC